MKPFYLRVFTAASLLFFPLSAQSNLTDDINLVDSLLEQYPEIDLTKEANLQVQLISNRYDRHLASYLSGKIFYVTGQKAKARQAFESIPSSSDYFVNSIFTYFEMAVSERIKDGIGQKNSSEIFFNNSFWVHYPDKESSEFQIVREILNSYERFNKEDRVKMAALDKVLKELDIDRRGEIEETISSIEKKFINNWADEVGNDLALGNLKDIKLKLEELEFGEKTYEFFTAYPNRARVLTMLGDPDEALKLLDKTKLKVYEFDELIKKSISENKDIAQEDKHSAFVQNSVMAKWYYAQALALFQKYRTAESKEEAAEFLFGKQGSVVSFFRVVRKYPENSYSFKSIIAFQKLRELIDKKFSKKLKELAISGLIQGKAFYTVEDYENAFKYLSKAVRDKNPQNSYEAYNLAVAAAVKLKNWDEADSFFEEMCKRHGGLNKAPKTYLTKLTNYLAGTYMKQAKEGDADLFENRALNVFKVAGKYGSTKTNVSLKYLLANRLLTKVSKLKAEPEKAKQILDKTKILTESLIDDHRLSIESAKTLKLLGNTFYQLKMNSKAIENIQVYLKKIKTFSTEIDQSYLNTKIFLAELFLAEKDYKSSQRYIVDLQREILKSKIAANVLNPVKQNLAGLEVRLLYSELNDLPETEAKLKYDAFIKKAESFIDKFPQAASRPYIMAQVATLYQKQEMMEKANTIYTALNLEYPNHQALQTTSINQVMALINERRGSEALQLLAKSDQLKELKDKTLFSFINQISDLIENYKEEDANSLLTVIKLVDRTKLKDSSVQALSLIQANVLLALNNVAQAEQVLAEMIAKHPRGPYIIDMKITYGKCLAVKTDYAELSKVYSSLSSMISRMNEGRGNANLSLKVSSEFSRLFSQAKDEKYLKKGKSISFLASQYNPNLLDELSKIYLERSTYWNAWYSNKLKMEDFVELKQDFLRRYPSSSYAPKLRKL